MTDYFCRNSESPCITVMHNGGAQRGHTVVTPEGVRHVFHHFSSGTFAHSDTYFSDSFIINPLVFADEYTEIKPDTDIYCSPACMWSTPFDMMTNQIIEESRGDKRHGSCGFGIWETIVRYRDTSAISFPEFIALEKPFQVQYMRRIRDVYMPERLKAMGVEEIPEEWQKVIFNENIIENFIDDCRFFNDIVKYSGDDIIRKYNTVVFEGAQGLLLSQTNTQNPENTTPSYTGAENPVKILESTGIKGNIEVCYITRSYLTRHGAGNFPQECTKAEINPDMTDRTNVPNEWQGCIRYGRIDISELRERISADFVKFSELNAEISLAVTHLNETGGKIITTAGEIPPSLSGFGHIYYSYSENEIKKGKQ